MNYLYWMLKLRRGQIDKKLGLELFMLRIYEKLWESLRELFKIDLGPSLHIQWVRKEQLLK